MQAVKADIAHLVESLAVDVSEGHVATQVRRPLRPVVFNLISFVLVLVVTGLLLRVGSSEQAFSSIGQERLGFERPAKTLVALPQPAFVQIAASHRGGQEGVDNTTLAVAPAAKIGGEARHAHAPTFEQVVSALGVRQDASNSGRLDVIRNAKVLARIPSAPEAAAVVSAAIAPALASSSVRASRTVSSSPRGLAIMPEVVKPGKLPISVAASNASPLLQHEVGVARVPPHQEIAAVAAKQAPRAKSVVTATSQAPFPTILSPTHTSIVPGLLAPVRLITRSASLVATPPTARVSVLTGAQPTAAGSTAMLSAGSRLGNARQQVPTANAAPRAVNIASVINGAAPASASITPGNISLATLTMRPGPRTTVLTSDIKDEMRRPASAWAYAEALPSELLGRESAARHSDSLEPSLQSQITEASAARLKVAENEALTSATRTSVTAPLLKAGEAVRAAPVRVIAVRAAPAAQDVLTARTHNPPAPNTKMAPQAAVAEPLASLVRTVAGQANPGASVTAKQMALAAPGQHSNLAPASGEYRKKQSVDTAKANADLSLSAPKYALTSSPRVSAKTDSPGGGVYGAGISEKACSAALVGDAPSPDVCGGIRLLDQIPRPAL